MAFCHCGWIHGIQTRFIWGYLVTFWAWMRLISSVDYFKSFKSPFSDNCECLITFLQVCGFEQIWLFTSVCSQTAPWRECFVTFWADMLLFTDLETFMCSQNAPLWECLVRIWAIMLLFTSVNYFMYLQSTFAWEYFVTFWVGMWLSFSVDQFMFFFKFSFSSNTFGKKVAIGLLILMTNHNNTKLFKGMRGEPVISYSSLFLTTSVMLRSVLPLLLLHKSQSGCPKKGREKDSFLPL